MLSIGKITRLPQGPGVYFFLKGRRIIYIGKATNLRDRVRSYFGDDLSVTRGPKLVRMLSEATRVDYKQTDSVLEALILESALVKKHLPKYNSDLKDDKSFSYVVITKEDYPRVLVVRGKELPEWTDLIKYVFGPFPHGQELREALKIIRKIFPYRDKCSPSGETAGKVVKQGCFDAQIGLCPGVCSGEISRSEYAKVIRSIILLFNGKKLEIIKGLRRHMRSEAKARNFEKAAELCNKIFALEHINDIALMKRNLALKGPSERGLRIEAYDIAHISGTHTVGSMVVMEDSALNKDEYRRFKIKGKNKSDDTANLAEMLERRLKHVEWRTPDLIVIDGGTAQKSIAEQVLLNTGRQTSSVKVVSIVKNDKHKPDHIMGDTKVVKDYHHDILLVNQEAHRFALAYHKLLRGRLPK